jgi:hypothetical protein
VRLKAEIRREAKPKFDFFSSLGYDEIREVEER